MRKRLEPSVCLVTVHRFPEIGGGEERFLQYFTSYLQEKGIRSVVVSSAVGSHGPNVVGAGFKPFRLPVAGYTLYMFLFSLLACLRIISLNRRHHFSVIHSIDSGYAGLAGLFASKILHLGFVVHAHCQRARLVSLSLALKGGIWLSIAPLYERFERVIDKVVLTQADKIVAVSSEIRDYAVSLGVATERVLVIPVGLDISYLKTNESDRLSVFHECGMPTNAFVIGYLGSLLRVKGTYALVEAFASLKREPTDDLFLLMVGDGNKDDLESRVKRRKLPSVIFAGFRRDIARFLAAMDVFVLPSMSEGVPYSLLEAMTVGKAIVTSDIPSIREIVSNEREALLIDPRDVSMLREALLRLHADAALRKRLGTNARRKAAQYSHDAVFSRIVELYGDLERDSSS